MKRILGFIFFVAAPFSMSAESAPARLLVFFVKNAGAPPTRPATAEGK